MQQWQDELTLSLLGQKIPPKYWDFPELEKGNIHKHCAYCVDMSCSKTLNILLHIKNTVEVQLTLQGIMK